MKLFVAPSLDDLKQIALDAVDVWAASQRARPAAQASMDAFKTAEAQKIKAGEASPLIEAEAALNRITPEEQADRILAAVAVSIQVELQRIEAKAAIRAATRHETVLAVLKNRDIRLNAGPQLGL
jgi:hypothetical protein